MKLIKFPVNAWLIPIVVWSMAANAQTCLTETILPSTAHLVDNLDGTVSDSKTGLMWKQCAEGQSGAGCSIDDFTKLTMIWQGALQQVQTVNNTGGFAGYNDWRLPNIKELETLIERQCSFPASNLTLFPDDNGLINGNNLAFWSSTMTFNDNVWGADYYSGWISPSMPKYISLRVRLVRNIKP